MGKRMSLDHAIQHLIKAEAKLTELKRVHDALTMCIPTFAENDQALVATLLDCLDPYREPEDTTEAEELL